MKLGLNKICGLFRSAIIRIRAFAGADRYMSLKPMSPSAFVLRGPAPDPAATVGYLTGPPARPPLAPDGAGGVERSETVEETYT